MDFLHVGFGDFVNQSRVVAVGPFHKQQTERYRLEALRSRGLIFDFTHGRSTKTVITLDSGHCVLSAILLVEIKWRMLPC